jgi:capsule polysaccharide export protein KpsE/RkpR
MALKGQVKQLENRMTQADVKFEQVIKRLNADESEITQLKSDIKIMQKEINQELS